MWSILNPVLVRIQLWSVLLKYNKLINSRLPVKTFRKCEIRKFPAGTKQETLKVLTPAVLQSGLLLGVGETCNVNHPSSPSCLFTASTEGAQPS